MEQNGDPAVYERIERDINNQIEYYPDDIELSESVYLNVASILKRYIEENEIEDIFYFNAEEDMISNVTNMIYTCRHRGREQTLYMDIDAFNLKCHVYQLLPQFYLSGDGRVIMYFMDEYFLLERKGE